MTDVLMYSGGMDSYIIGAVYNIDEYVFVRMGNEDNERELELLQRYAKEKYIEVHIVNMPDMARYELSNKIIPYRNHMLAMIGAQYGNHIYFGFTGGDTTKDKDFVFKAQIEGMLNYFALDQHKVNHQQYPYTIEMPYKEASKGEMVHDFIKSGHNPEELWTHSRSCYAGSTQECGKCRSCQRKYVALKVNGMYWAEDVFENDVREGLEDFLRECKAKGRFRKEIKEIEAAIEGDVLYYA